MPYLTGSDTKYLADNTNTHTHRPHCIKQLLRGEEWLSGRMGRERQETTAHGLHVTHFLLLIWPILEFVSNTSQVVRVGLVGLRTHSVCDGVCVCVGDPGHFPLSCAHIWGRDIDARSWSGKRGGSGRKGGLIRRSTNLNFLISNSTNWVSLLTTW